MDLKELFEKEKPTLAEVKETHRELAAREIEIRARLDAIHGEVTVAEAEGTAEELRALEDERDLLNVELGLVYPRVERLIALERDAERRESPALAAKLMKDLEPMLEAAEEAKSLWLQRREELNQLAGRIGYHRMKALEAGLVVKSVPGAIADRITLVLETLGDSRNFGDIAFRARLDRAEVFRKTMCGADDDHRAAVLRLAGIEVDPRTMKKTAA